MSSDTDGGFSELLSGVRIGQFVSVGVVGALAENVIVATLTILFGIWAVLAKVVGAEVSITIMFLINDNWTFAAEGGDDARSLGARYLRSHLVRLGGISVAFVVLWLLVDFTTIELVVMGADFWPTVANAVGIGVGMVLNYCFESVFTWKVHR